VRLQRNILIFISLPIAVAGVLGCIDSPDVSLGHNSDVDPAGRAQVADVPPRFNPELDLLFVVDDSENMAARQLALASSFRALTHHLTETEGGLPDMHVGIVSTDLGAGGFDYPGCAQADGRNGLLQATPTHRACNAPDDKFLISYGAGAGDRVTNFEGSLEASFECVSQIGTNGCMYRQPLEAMRRALDGTNPENDGFLRRDAVLAVVLLTEADDCSARTGDFFDPQLLGAVGEPMFRCFQFGVKCWGDDVRMPGQRADCAARADSELVHNVDAYKQFLEELKQSRDQVVVSGITGDPSLVEVSVDFDGTQQLMPACADAAGNADPAVRLDDFVSGFRRGAELRSICDGVSSAVVQTAQQIRRGLGTRCLEGYVSDSDPYRAGRQPDCLVSDVAPDESRTPMVACDRPYQTELSSVTPCYAFKRGVANCSSYPTQLGIEIQRGDAPATDTHVVVDCYVDDGPTPD